MDKDRFGARFGLKNVEVHNVDACVRRRMEKWREAKGANAWVLSIEGKTLRMFIPALPLSPAQLRQGVEQALAEEIGATRARKICESEQGWKTMVQWGVLEYLLMDQDCVFTRTKEEGRLSQRELATFNVTFDQRDVSKGAMPRFGPELQLIEGYDYLWLAESHFFSWTAMAKAPSGYFCSEPILGVASRPKPSVVIEEELDTGKVTIRNLRGDGSVEHLNLNDRSPPSP